MYKCMCFKNKLVPTIKVFVILIHTEKKLTYKKQYFFVYIHYARKVVTVNLKSTL